MRQFSQRVCEIQPYGWHVQPVKSIYYRAVLSSQDLLTCFPHQVKPHFHKSVFGTFQNFPRKTDTTTEPVYFWNLGIRFCFFFETFFPLDNPFCQKYIKNDKCVRIILTLLADGKLLTFASWQKWNIRNIFLLATHLCHFRSGPDSTCVLIHHVLKQRAWKRLA